MGEQTGPNSQHHVPISEQTVGECHNRGLSESPKGYRDLVDLDLYRVGEFRNSGAYEYIGGTANGLGPRGQYTGLRQGSGISPVNFIRAQHYLAEQGYRPSNGSSITRLHDSATNTQQDVDKASDGGSEEPSL